MPTMDGNYIDLEPPRAQVKAGRLALTDKMELVEVESDVFGVVEQLKRIDEGLHMTFHKSEGVFVLFWKGLNHQGEYTEDFVGAYTELDARIVHLIERLAAKENSNRYLLSYELDKLEEAKRREADHMHAERQGPFAEKLAFALKKDLNVKSTVHMSSKVGKRRKR